MDCFEFKFKLHLFYNDYETSYITYINHARWHRTMSDFVTTVLSHGTIPTMPFDSTLFYIS